MDLYGYGGGGGGTALDILEVLRWRKEGVAVVAWTVLAWTVWSSFRMGSGTDGSLSPKHVFKMRSDPRSTVEKSTAAKTSLPQVYSGMSMATMPDKGAEAFLEMNPNVSSPCSQRISREFRLAPLDDSRESETDDIEIPPLLSAAFSRSKSCTMWLESRCTSSASHTD